MIAYKKLLDKAFRHLMSDLFEEVQANGLSGVDNHFYITFDTNYPGVRLSPSLKEQHPDKLTIVLQHQFEDFFVQRQENIYQTSVSVTLFFSGKPQKLTFPLGAVLSLSDPFEEFSVQFDQFDETASPTREPKESSPPQPEESADNIVDLSSFRK